MPFPSFEAKDVVGAVRDEGNLTGRVGDLGLGFTNPAPEGGRSMGVGFLLEVATGFVVVVVAAFFGASRSLDEAGVDFFCGAKVGMPEDTFVVLLVGLRVLGDLGALETDLAAVETALGAGFVAVVVFVLLPFVDALVRPLAGATLLPLDTDFSVGFPGSSFVFVSSSSVTLSGFGFGARGGLRLSFFGEDFAGDLGGAVGIGDSGIGSSDKFVLKPEIFLAMFSVKTSGFSGTGCGVLASVSSLSLRLDTETDSSLGSFLNPTRPSFSIATKVVRTLESGRGE